MYVILYVSSFFTQNEYNLKLSFHTLFLKIFITQDLNLKNVQTFKDFLYIFHNIKYVLKKPI